MSQTKSFKIVERVIILLFLFIVTVMSTIWVYRSVINSDWYEERQFRSYFNAMSERITSTADIDTIKLDIHGEEKWIKADEIPANLFVDMTCPNFAKLTDKEKLHNIFRSDIVVVFYTDDRQDAFFITDTREIYWADVKIQCPSLIAWIYNTAN